MEGNENEKQYRECPKGRTSIAYERKRNANYRHDSQGHSDVDKKMHEDTAGDAVAIYSGECFPAFFCIFYYSPYKENV